MNIPNIPFTNEELTKKLHEINDKASKNTTIEKLKLAFSCIDLTTLNSTDTITHVSEFTRKVNQFSSEYPDMPNVGAICVYPNMVASVKETLGIEHVQIAAVAGGFPSSMTFESIKGQEAVLAVEAGADEIDIVLPLWAFLDGNQEYCFEEIKAIKPAIGNAHLKVILESGILADPEKIWQASILSLQAGADFIKTSTGKMPVAATPEAAFVMCSALKWWCETQNEKRGFKPAGGISTAEEAMLYLTIVEEILGEEWMNNKLFRIGASRLANNLLSEICNEDVKFF